MSSDPGNGSADLIGRVNHLLPRVFPAEGRRALLLCSGDLPSQDLLDAALEGVELFLCTDGAGVPYHRLPRIPDLVIGDLDSAEPISEGHLLHPPERLHIPEQETTDSEKALLHLVEEGFREVLILGWSGGRLDHTLYNLNLMERFRERLRICLCDEHQLTVRIGAGDDREFGLPPGTGIALLPLNGPVTGLAVEGTAWPLTAGELQVGGPATVSNRTTNPPLRIEVDWGSLILMVSLAPPHAAEEQAP